MKIRALIVTSVLLAYIAPAGAQGIGQIPVVSPIGYQQLSSLASSTALTVPNGAKEAFIVCTGQTVSWRDDGIAPTASVGVPLPVNTPFPYVGNLVAIRLIQTSASASCNVSYYR